MKITLAQNLRKLRRDRDLTQERLAEYLSVSSQAVSKWECGMACPDLALIGPLTKLLHVTADELLSTTQKFDKTVFADALNATAAHRCTTQQIVDVPAILHNIAESPELKTMWDKYRKQFAYAADIEYDQIMTVLKGLLG